MIDTREPPDGDFARYVENLSRLPPGHGVNPGPRAPGSQGRVHVASMQSSPASPATMPSPAALPPAPRALNPVLAAALAAAGNPALASTATARLREHLQPLLLRALRAISGVAIAAMLAGIALIVLSDMAELPFRIDPTTGLKVFAGGFAVLWLARAARARIDR